MYLAQIFMATGGYYTKSYRPVCFGFRKVRSKALGIRVALEHSTEYNYDRPVMLSPQVVRLRPAPHCRTPITSYSLKVEPGDHFINWQQDPQGNYLARLTFPKRTRKFSLSVDLVADLVVINPFDFFLESDATSFPFKYAPSLSEELRPYLHTEAHGPKFAEYLRSLPKSDESTNDFLVAVNQRLNNDISYVVRMEPGIQTPEETLTKGSGSCRDTAWLLIQLFRRMGLAARFTSGYLIQLVADQKPIEGPEGPLSDFTDLHAWAEVYLPGAGWVGLDPTSGLFAGEGHIPLACTPNPESAAPVTGASEPAEADFAFHMAVHRIGDEPRITKPFRDSVWESIDAIGEQVDHDLSEFDVRLTMGGEPTFVSIDDRESDEWHSAAVGPEKRRLAGTLFERLSKRFAKDAMHYSGQGKWYPGESLPRWSLECYWAEEGDPLWSDPSLRAEQGRNYGYTHEQAQDFMKSLAENLGVDDEYIKPGHEDVYYYIWRERRLPANVDPLDADLSDPEERDRLARIFSQGLNTVAGYALPLRPSMNDDGWESGEWALRDDRMYLIPGDAPMGYRLPLESLLAEPEGERQITLPPDPMAINRHEMPPVQRARTRMLRQQSSELPLSEDAPKHDVVLDPSVIRTAVCAEARDGCLHIFMPPIDSADAYFALIHAIEKTAESTGMPVMIEGYTPPSDPRVKSFSVQPDPGVIEVNIHPANSWADLKDISEGLYEEARYARLTTEKFAIDGRSQGTGGGGHIVLGGPAANESPFVRRPDLLASMVGYWHNHPALSYLFAGGFIGPTSQAPRADESRRDMTAELEIAMKHIEHTESQPPWFVDRVFRNLLIDATGNTHRAEFCIDKLFSPDGPGGRRGLLELRGFEMPPHPKMSLLQQVLVRSLLASFWKRQYQRPLVRWHNTLYDKFMLPHFVRDDFEDVLFDLRDAGYGFQSDWFDAQFDFRFPKLGEITQRGINLELRTALEPWHVMGETGAIGGTVRFVDSSTERLQVKVRGLTDSRHVITCNRQQVPLHPTGVEGEFVAGVRFRAWKPPLGMHPEINPHSPLVFDVIDTWYDKAIGGCTYWSTHPGGRNYETFPVNHQEAESRQRSRFAPIGHTPGRVESAAMNLNHEGPMTLDLRRFP